MKVVPIDKAQHLRKRLGKARTDRIRFHERNQQKRQAAATNLVNPHRERFQNADLYDPPPWISDILTGAARIDGQRKPLSSQRLLAILQCMAIINTREIMTMLNTGERQARRYMQAIKFALPILEKQIHEHRSHTDKGDPSDP